MQKIAVERTGSPAWPRYLLHDDQGRWWTGDGWSGDRRSALLHADFNEAAHTYRRLEEEQWAGVPSTDFEGVITLKVWSGTRFTVQQLQDYMHQAVSILLNHETHGSGPVPDSLVRIDIDWSRLTEAQPGDRP